MNGKRNEKLVSIVIPIFNSEKYLNECLLSIIEQTYKNIEIIAVNDGSTDGSKSICDKYAKSDKRLKIINRSNKGVSSSRNIGLRRSKGDYITFADSDDWLEPDAIENMVSIIERENVDCVRTATFISSKTKEREDELSLEEKKYYKEDIPNILNAFVSGDEKCYVFLLLLKKSLLPKLRLFNERIHMMEDTCFYMDLLSKINSIYLSNVKTYHYLQSDSSATRSPGRYIDNIGYILSANSEIKKILRKTDLLKDDIKNSLDLEHVRLMSEYSYRAYVNAPDSMGRILNALRNDKGFRKLSNSVDLSRLTIGHRYTVKYLLSDDNAKLFRWFKLRLKVDQFQGFVNKIGLTKTISEIKQIDTTGDIQ
jgi:glycosyltransferase involved in cell wall biosynthesis